MAIPMSSMPNVGRGRNGGTAASIPRRGASVPTHYEMRVDGDPVPYADGSATVVFIDMKTQKSRRIPEDIRARLEQAQPQA